MITGAAISFFVGLAAGAVVFVFWQKQKYIISLGEKEKEIKSQAEEILAEYRVILAKREKEMGRRMYELGILKELGERIGYSLNIKNIAEIIIGSLHQFIDYSAAAYMLLEPQKILFRAHLEKSVSRKFIDEVRNRMLTSLSALLDQEFKKEKTEEVLSGAILLEELETSVSSFFNIPLVIGERVVGVLTVAHTVAGLYKEEEMTILYKITGQASRAVTRLQEVVKTEQRKLNAMVESMVEGVVMTDKDYRLLVVNPAAKCIIGLEEKAETTIFDFIDRLGEKFDIRGKLEEGIKLDKVLTFDGVSIGDRFFKIFVAPVKSRYGIREEEILGGVVIFHDITHEKELDRAKTEFISIASHQLRTPLSGIKWVIESLIENKGLTKEQKDKLNDLYFSNESLIMIVNDLMNVAKIESGKILAEKKVVNIVDTINSVISTFKLSADEKNQLIDFKVKTEVEDIKIQPLMLSESFKNLLSNAVDYGEADSTITIEINKEGNFYVISVNNNGLIITGDEGQRIFTKFYRGLGARAVKTAGSGLGLFIAKSYVEANGGKIWFTSDKEMGTTFYFTIPADGV